MVYHDIVVEISVLLDRAVRQKAKGKIGVMFSGGVDSTTLAFMLQQIGFDFTCYTSVLDDPDMRPAPDLEAARKVAEAYSFDHQIVALPLKLVEGYARKVIEVTGSRDAITIGVGIPIFLACERAMQAGCTTVFSGLGSEEIFAGYQRHKESKDINAECRKGLALIQERDLNRDNAIASHHGLKIVMPFLDQALVDFALQIPGKYKIKNDVEKAVFRDAAVSIGVDKEFAFRKKKAAQYGSNFHKALQKLSRQKGFKYVKEYLNQL